MKYLATTKNRKKVYYDNKNGHAITHFEDTPELYKIVINIIQSTEIKEDSLAFNTEFPDFIGYTDLVSNKPDDVILYAKRKNRETYTCFNKSQSPIKTNLVTTIFRPYDDNYELYSAWVGRVDVPPFPGHPNEKPESKEFWNKHSLCWGKQEIIEDTLTSECPW